ncbi:MAG: haloacid dehalogenase [Anaerolineae bacterium]|nr:haloacid dehalogenase [Anaerolineae bacterium]
MTDLTTITEQIQAAFTAKNAARDDAIARSRELIRRCAESIRAIHRHEWPQAEEKLVAVRTGALELRQVVAQYPDLYHSGYTQDALKEVVEAHATYALVRNQDLPTPDSLDVEHNTYLNGLAEAATELRRFILDILRRKDGDSDEAERLLDWMDSIYDELVTFDFPDAITGGLRRQTDVVRGVLERTRGDLTMTLRQQRMEEALRRFEEHTLHDGSDTE